LFCFYFFFGSNDAGILDYDDEGAETGVYFACIVCGWALLAIHAFRVKNIFAGAGVSSSYTYCLPMIMMKISRKSTSLDNKKQLWFRHQG
jgi:hypothetical protein